MTFDIRDHLEHLEPNPKEKGKYFCPACGGHNLSVSLTTGAYNCWSDDTEAHRILIRENLSPAKLEITRPEPGRRSWNYYTVEGKSAARIDRVDYGDGRDKRVTRENNKEYMPAVTPLYWAECIKTHTEEGGRVFIVEGEDCCDSMRSLGFNAITFLGGSVGYKKELYYDLLFQIKDSIVLVPDMDKPGIKLMDAVAGDFPEALWCYVQGPNYYYWGSEKLPISGGFDVSDAIRNGATPERIISWVHRRQSFALTGQALEVDVEVADMLDGLMRVYTDTLDITVRELKVAQYIKSSGLKDLGWTIQRAMKHCACEQFQRGEVEVIDSYDLLTLKTKRPRWVIPGFLPAASVIILGASGGTGKTTLCYQIAKHVAIGEPWSDFPTVKGKVLIISTDESSHDTKEKLQTIDYANVPRGAVSFIRFWRFNQINMLEEIIRQIDPALIIVDSLTSTTAGMAGDRISSSAGDCLYELRDIAERYECSFIVLHHLNKQDEFRDSTTYVDNASEAWKLTKDENKGDFILDYVKSRSGFQGKAVLRRRLEQYQWSIVGRIGSACDWDIEQRVCRWVNENLAIDGVENWLTADAIAARTTGLTSSEVHTALPILRLTGRISCETSVFAGKTFRRYAAWTAGLVAKKPSNVVSIAPEACNPVDEFDDLMIQTRHAFNNSLPSAQMIQMLETYPWPEGGRERFWDDLDSDLKDWLQKAS